MRKKPSRSFLFLIITVVGTIALPVAFSTSIRNKFSGLMAPIWSKMTSPNSGVVAELHDKIKRLELENVLLRNNPIQDLPKEGYFSAKVIFRTHAAWQNYLWINVGSANIPFSLKNAPVMKGDVLVGVIDEVKPYQARVRLLTDPTLNPSVRVERKGLLLAKGELNGRLKPGFRLPGTKLKGTGFNYDFPDVEGPSRDLRDDILKPGDFLVTTGFDGVFPKGLKVAQVTKIYPLKEGDFYYDLEAESLAGSLNNLERLHVLPPLQ